MVIKSFWMIRLLVFLVFLISLPKVASAECTELTSSLMCSFDKSHTFKTFCKFDSGDIYKGYMNCKGFLSGNGEYVWENGSKYSGSYMDGKRHGKGTREYSSGGKYIGDWVNGKRQGNGTYYFADGSKYDGDIYRGQFFRGNFHGKGTYTFANGRVRKGIWKNGKLDGKYIFEFPNGRVDEQIWENHKFVESKTIKTGKSKAEIDKEKRLAEIRRQAEIAADEQYDRIYNNCIIDKLPADANRTLESAIKSSCSDIADDPSFLEKMKYN